MIIFLHTEQAGTKLQTRSTCPHLAHRSPWHRTCVEQLYVSNGAHDAQWTRCFGKPKICLSVQQKVCWAVARCFCWCIAKIRLHLLKMRGIPANRLGAQSAFVNCMKMSSFYLKWCIKSWYTNVSDWRLTNIVELQNHSFPSSFLTMNFNSLDPQGDQTLVIYPGEISSVYLNTRVHLLKIVGYKVGSVSLCNFCSDRWGNLTSFTRQKFKTRHTISCSGTVVPSCGSRTDWHIRWWGQVVAGRWSDFCIWQSLCLLIALLIW